MHQYQTRAKAAEAIAAQLHPDDAELREQATTNYFRRLYDALCAGELIGRDPTNLLPITRRDLAGAIAFGGCLISDTDLNAWLAHLGIHVVIGGEATANLTLPSDEQLLYEKEQMTDDGIRDAHARLAAKYGVDKRRIKYRCEKATGKRKKAVRAASSPFHIARLSGNRGS